MELEEKYKLALFAVIRSISAMSEGIRLGKNMTEINAISVTTMNCVMDSCDFEDLKRDYESALN